MIKKLQIRFVFVSMAAVISVLIILLSVISIFNYREMIASSDKMLSLIAENDGFFPGSPELKKSAIKDAEVIQPTPEDIRRMPDGSFEKEAPYETRYFSVSLNAEGLPVTTNTGSIAAVSGEDAVNMALKVYNSGREKGFLDSYRFCVRDTDGGCMVLFLNRSRELSSFNSSLRTTAGVALLGMLFVFILIVIFSKRAIKPVAESYEKQKHFITDASHELKTPLAVINSSTEVLEMTYGESEWTESIKGQVARLSKLTNDLVSLTRMDEAGGELLRTDFSLSDAVTVTLEPYRALADGEGKRFSVRCEGNVSLCGNEEAIRKLLVILADNALKYSSEMGSINVSLRQTGRGAALQFTNTVDGIEKGSHDEMFERFYRADSSRSSAKTGYGIGLSIAKSIVQAHRGSISAKSENGESLTISVTL